MYKHTHKFGETALHVAVNQEHEDIVQLLLEANADPDLKEVNIVTTTVYRKQFPNPLHKKIFQSESCINALERNGITNHKIDFSLYQLSFADYIVPILYLTVLMVV